MGVVIIMRILKDFRMKTNLSSIELARILGVDASTISRCEQCANKPKVRSLTLVQVLTLLKKGNIESIPLKFNNVQYDFVVQDWIDDSLAVNRNIVKSKRKKTRFFSSLKRRKIGKK